MDLKMRKMLSLLFVPYGMLVCRSPITACSCIINNNLSYKGQHLGTRMYHVMGLLCIHLAWLKSFQTICLSDASIVLQADTLKRSGGRATFHTDDGRAATVHRQIILKAGGKSCENVSTFITVRHFQFSLYQDGSWYGRMSYIICNAEGFQTLLTECYIRVCDLQLGSVH